MWVDAQNQVQLQRNKAYREWADAVMDILVAAGFTPKVIVKASDYNYGWYVPPEQYIIELSDSDKFVSRHILAMLGTPPQVAETVSFFHRFYKASAPPAEEG